MLKAAFLSLISLLVAQPLFGFALEGLSWTLNRTVQVQLSLGKPSHLSDGFASFNKSAADALQIWNEHLAHLTFAPILNSPVVPAGNDYEFSAAFSSTVFGDAFGTGTLAVTVLSDRKGITAESDTLFNTVYTWDSYGGPLRRGVQEFHRVALHEFGHMVGLDHPDQAGQFKVAIMNSHVSDVESLQADDIAGAEDLYGAGPAELLPNDASILANISTRGQVAAGDKGLIGGFIIQGSQPATVILRAIGFSLSGQGIAGALTDPVITVYDANQHEVAMNDDWITGATPKMIASYHLDPPNTIESALLLTLQPGAYTAVISGYTDADQTTAPGIGLFELYDVHSGSGRAGNLSTRGQVLGGDNVLIGGLIVGGTAPKPVVVRALGPSLGDAGVADPLADPTLELHDANGALLRSNNDWQKGPDAAVIEAEGFAPARAKEAALQATLNPGSYTAIVSGVNGATGIGLVEIYDMSDPAGL